MKTSDKGIFTLITKEGIVPAPYRDSKNIWTYGIGHTKSAGAPDPAKMPKGMPTDLDKALKEVFDLFPRVLARYEQDVNDAVKVPLKQHQFDALVSWHYNTGAIRSATLTKKLNAGDYAGAAAQFMVWNKPPEIIPRRKKEQDLFLYGKYPETDTVPVWKADSFGRVIWTPVRRLTMQQVMSLVKGDVPAKTTTQFDFIEWLKNLFKGG
jgi:lysozyme